MAEQAGEAAEAAKRRADGAERLPAGRHGLPREFVLESQRRRMIEAMALVVGEQGYERASVARVVKVAGVSRKTFYEHFTDKQACFLDAYDTVFGGILLDVGAAYEAAEGWPEKVRSGLDVLLTRLAADPHYARAGIVEVLAAGEAALERRDAALRAFQSFFDPARPEVPDHGAPPIVIEATIGGIYEVIYRRILTDGAESLQALHDDLTYLALTPFLGEGGA